MQDKSAVSMLEYKMRDLIATTARRHERDADDVSFDEGSPSVVLSK